MCGDRGDRRVYGLYPYASVSPSSRHIVQSRATIINTSPHPRHTETHQSATGTDGPGILASKCSTVCIDRTLHLSVSVTNGTPLPPRRPQHVALAPHQDTMRNRAGRRQPSDLTLTARSGEMTTCASSCHLGDPMRRCASVPPALQSREEKSRPHTPPAPRRQPAIHAKWTMYAG